jgi:hypothetical protein
MTFVASGVLGGLGANGGLGATKGMGSNVISFANIECL